MITTIVSNGVLKIILTPETDLEKVALKKLVNVKADQAGENFVVMNRPMPDSVILSNEEPVKTQP